MSILQHRPKLEDWTASVCRESFWAFVREFWEEVPGAGKLIPNWHMEYLCQELQAVAERVFDNRPDGRGRFIPKPPQSKLHDVLVNVSPGTSKSTIISILFPAWVWTRMPSARIITASHTDSLALDLATKSRAVIKSETYRACFPGIEFREDQDGKGYYANNRGGDRFTCTVAGKTPTGMHAHYILIDDPIDPKKVLSEAELKTARDFITNSIPSRKVDKLVTVTVLVMQRLGVGDPSDVMLEEAKKEGAAGVKHVCLPAELAKGDDGVWLEGNVQPKELARRYVDGLMDPNRLGRDALREFKARGDHYYSTQFQQRPYTLTGGMFHADYFNQRRKAAPYEARRVVYIDRASTDMGGCFTAMVLMAKDDTGYYVENVVRGQWEPTERNDRILAFALACRARYGPRYMPVIYVEAEGGSSGKDAFKAIARLLEGFIVREDRPTGNKATRAEPWSSQCAAKNVYLIDDGTWDVNAFVQEHLAFPMGKFLDQVDAAAGAFNILAGARTGQGLRIMPIHDKKRDAKLLRLAVLTEDELAMTGIDARCLLVWFADPSARCDVSGRGLSEGSLRRAAGEVGHVMPHDDRINNVSVSHETHNQQQLNIHDRRENGAGGNGLYASGSGGDSYPPHSLHKLIDKLRLDFADVAPAEKQAEWTPELAKAVMSRDDGKKLWGFITRKRDPQPEVIVFVANDHRAESAARAVCDVLRLPRMQLWVAADGERKQEGVAAGNAHVYDQTRLTRSTVV